MADAHGWTGEELKASVGAYLDMLALEEAGTPYSKADYRRALRAGPLAARTDPSIEYRMRNISSALEELCLPRIVGYRPAKNVGNRVKDQIHALLRAAGVVEAELAQPAETHEDLEARTRGLRQRRGKTLLRGKPRGQQVPRKASGTFIQFVRDPLVRAWVLEASDGRCESCAAPAPFTDGEGKPYLEVHHVVTLANGGPDTVENAVAVCPNCHRRLHLGQDRDVVRGVLYSTVARLEA